MTASASDLLAVLICTVTPAASVLLLVILVVVENALVKLVAGKSSEKRALPNGGSQNAKVVSAREKIKASLEAVLQLVSIAILTKMATLLIEELYEMLSESKESSEAALAAKTGTMAPFHCSVAAVVAGIIAAVIIVQYAEGGGGHEEGDGGKDDDSKEEKTSAPSSRGVILAMLIHTCSEGLAAGIVMSNKSDSGSSGEGDSSIASMLDIKSAYFISLALHNISEGLVVATAVRAEIEDEAASSKNEGKRGRQWILPAIVKTTLSHIGQPFGLLAVLYSAQIGLSGLSEMHTFVAFIQGVSFGSIGAAVVFEALPEFLEAMGAFKKAFFPSLANASTGKKRKSE